MSWFSILLFVVVFAGGAFVYGYLEHKIAPHLARPRGGERGGAHPVRRLPAPASDKWTHRMAENLLAGGAVKWK